MRDEMGGKPAADVVPKFVSVYLHTNPEEAIEHKEVFREAFKDRETFNEAFTDKNAFEEAFKERSSERLGAEHRQCERTDHRDDQSAAGTGVPGRCEGVYSSDTPAARLSPLAGDHKSLRRAARSLRAQAIRPPARV